MSVCIPSSWEATLPMHSQHSILL